jgi:mRNA interferase RelE/StbE
MTRDAENPPVPYAVVVLPEAVRQLQRLPKSVRRNADERIQSLAENPQPQQAKLLKGLKGLWRSRVGDYRILYRIDHAGRRVTVLDVGNRKDIYRGL